MNNINYVAVIDAVQEVTLACTADLEFWRRRLAREGLEPFAENGRAGILISATAFKWMGLPSRELTIAVAVRGEHAAADFYLAHAFNASTMLAWMERAFFQTPYTPGKVWVDARIPASLQAQSRQTTVLRAAMLGKRTPENIGDETWQIKIHLPNRKLYYARLGGATQIFPASATDTFEVCPAAPGDIFSALVESQLTLQQWRVRPRATHARSKTYTATRP